MTLRPFLLTLLLVGCPGPDPEQLPDELDDCADGTDLVWADAEAIFATHCTRCHSSTLGEGERNGAPLVVNLDQEESVAANARAIWIMVRGGSMPPDADDMPVESALVVHEWLGCAVR